MSRILIVDDDSQVAWSFARILLREGYDVVAVVDAESALKAVAEDQPFNGVLLDLRMPNVDGLALLRRLRRIPRGQRTPVAIVTSQWLLDDQVETELRELGAMIRFKPLWRDDLTEITRALVSRSTGDHPAGIT